MPHTTHIPDRTVLCKNSFLEHPDVTGVFPNIVFRMCRTPDRKRVVMTWVMYEDEDKTFSVQKGWKVPDTPLPRPYEIRAAGYKGRGVYATRDIQFGEVILRELPIILMPSRVPGASERYLLQLLYWLEPTDRKFFLSLHNCHKRHAILTGIEQTNAFGIFFPESVFCDIYTAVCRDLSLFNHSCSPNAIQTSDCKTLIFTLRAQRLIRAGEEITLNYIDLLAPHEERRRDLFKNYNFLCSCRACTVDSSLSDARRTLISTTESSYDADFHAWCIMPQDEQIRVSERQIEHFSKVLRAMHEESLVMARARITERLALLYNALRDTRNFKMYAAMTAEALRATGGRDHKVAEWQRRASDPSVGTLNMTEVATV